MADCLVGRRSRASFLTGLNDESRWRSNPIDGLMNAWEKLDKCDSAGVAHPIVERFKNRNRHEADYLDHVECG